jgi:hypothetical protein
MKKRFTEEQIIGFLKRLKLPSRPSVRSNKPMLHTIAVPKSLFVSMA